MRRDKEKKIRNTSKIYRLVNIEEDSEMKNIVARVGQNGIQSRPNTSIMCVREREREKERGARIQQCD